MNITKTRLIPIIFIGCIFVISSFSVAYTTPSTKDCTQAGMLEPTGTDSIDAEIYNTKGLALLGEGSYQEAGKKFQKVTELEPTYAAAFYSLNVD